MGRPKKQVEDQAPTPETPAEADYVAVAVVRKGSYWALRYLTIEGGEITAIKETEEDAKAVLAARALRFLWP